MKERYYFKTAEILNQKEIVGANIASISTDRLKQDWGSTLTLSYLLNSKYFGEIDKNLDDEIIYTELKKFNISYFFVWGINREFENKYFNKIFKDSLILEHSIFSDEITKDLIIYKVN